MKKIKCPQHWARCGLCGKMVKHDEECFSIQYKKVINSWSTRYVKEYWHLRHFVMRDYSARCKNKMECATSESKSVDIGCSKKLCTNYR